MRLNMNANAAKQIRCAIYTRVSDDQGLERDFNSLDAQYDAAQSYIRSQAYAGWELLPERYDDGGFSGSIIDRPALRRLLDDVGAGEIDVIVVYKVDRLTRSLAHFAKLVELFDTHNISFASVTQPFNTTTSMGRLTLNVLLSFAQFEREIASERIRDKMAASKRKGIWVGGPIPLGYQTNNRKISINKPEAEQVRMIFTKYLELGTLRLLMAYLVKRNVTTKPRILKSGKMRGAFHLPPVACPTCCAIGFTLEKWYFGEKLSKDRKRQFWTANYLMRCNSDWTSKDLVPTSAYPRRNWPNRRRSRPSRPCERDLGFHS
jgi:site-specific DNA recombinase